MKPRWFEGTVLPNHRANVGAIPWEVGGMNKQQKAIVIGSILGDGFLQKTGSKNARLRLEHGLKQKEYLIWKCQILKNYFQSKPQVLERKNPVFGKTYQYIRAQSYSGSEFGKFYCLFYKDYGKIIPKQICNYLKDPLGLAVWFMDDGYYYPRDKIAYLYIPKYDQISINNLLVALNHNFNLFPTFKKKKRGEYVLIFSVSETNKLMGLICKNVIPSMAYKLKDQPQPLDPVSTDALKRVADTTLGRDMSV